MRRRHLERTRCCDQVEIDVVRKPYVAGKTYTLKNIKVIAVAGVYCSDDDESVKCEFADMDNCIPFKCASAQNRGQPFFFLTPNNLVKARLLGQLDESTNH